MSRYIKGKSFYNKPWYNSYRCMMSRCYRKNDASYKSYGGRNIKVCEECGKPIKLKGYVFDDDFVEQW